MHMFLMLTVSVPGGFRETAVAKWTWAPVPARQPSHRAAMTTGSETKKGILLQRPRDSWQQLASEDARQLSREPPPSRHFCESKNQRPPSPRSMRGPQDSAASASSRASGSQPPGLKMENTQVVVVVISGCYIEGL